MDEKLKTVHVAQENNLKLSNEKENSKSDKNTLHVPLENKLNLSNGRKLQICRHGISPNFIKLVNGLLT